MWKFGSEGVDYMNWCAKLAESYDIGVPWIMCQQDNAPAPMVTYLFLIFFIYIFCSWISYILFKFIMNFYKLY